MLAKKSVKACGRWKGLTVEGRGEDSDLPRRVFVMLCNCLEVEHARILEL